MRYFKEQNLRNFEFWGGAVQTASLLELHEFEALEEYLDEITHEYEWSETEINDFIWFETDWIATFLGFEDFEEMYEIRSKRK